MFSDFTPVIPVISHNRENRQYSAATSPEETAGGPILSGNRQGRNKKAGIRIGRLAAAQGLACVTVVFAYAWNAVCIGLLYVALFTKLSPAQLSKVTFSEVARNVTARILSLLLDHAADVGGAILLIWLVTWASGRCRSGSIGLAAPLGPHSWRSRY
jgi:hypothetical protein